MADLSENEKILISSYGTSEQDFEAKNPEEQEKLLKAGFVSI